MKLVISDTSPLRALHFLSLLDLLPQLFERVVITPAVQAELEQPLRRIFSPVLVSALPFVELRAPSDPVLVAELRKTLDLGEAEAIAMAIELKATVLIDEVRGRAEAERRGLVLTGVVGVLLQAKKAGLVSRVEPLIDSLKSGLNFRVSDPVRSTVLRLAGELPKP